jgi:hypothetical protein
MIFPRGANRFIKGIFYFRVVQPFVVGGPISTFIKTLEAKKKKVDIQAAAILFIYYIQQWRSQDF